MYSDLDSIHVNKCEDGDMEEGELEDDGVDVEIFNSETPAPEEMPQLSKKRPISSYEHECSNSCKKKTKSSRDPEKKRKRPKKRHKSKHESQGSYSAPSPPTLDHDDFVKGINEREKNKEGGGGGPGSQCSGGDTYQEGFGKIFCDQSDQSPGCIEGLSNSVSHNQPLLVVPEFLPPVQRKLFIRIQKKQQQEKNRAIIVAESSERHNEVDADNWYSSEDEGDSGSIVSILKTLQQCSKTEGLPKTEGASSDPRLQKAQHLQVTSRPAGPNITQDPCLAQSIASSQCLQNNPSSSPGGSLLTHKATLKPTPPLVYNSLPVDRSSAEEEEEERVLRDNTVLIPLDPLIGVTLHDPRSLLQQFSHIKRELVLKKPAFAKKVLCTPEDLKEIPITRKDFLALGPRHLPVASRDPRLTSSQQQPHAAISTSLHTSSGPSQTVPPATPPISIHSERPVNICKAISDPRLQLQKFALKQSSEPSNQQVSALTTTSASTMPTHMIAPCNLRLLSVGGVGQRVGGGSTSTGSSILSSARLCGPWKRSADKSECADSNTSHSMKKPRNSMAASTKQKAKESLFAHRSPLDQPELKKGSRKTSDRYNSYNQHRPKPSPLPNLGIHGGALVRESLEARQSPAELQTEIHSVPVSTAFSLEKQGRWTADLLNGNSLAKLDPAEQDKTSLKDVFKGFDPTASPFGL